MPRQEVNTHHARIGQVGIPVNPRQWRQARLYGGTAFKISSHVQIELDGVVFRSNAERNRIFYGLLKRWDKAWSQKLAQHADAYGRFQSNSIIAESESD